MMAITTKSSMRVKPRFPKGPISPNLHAGGREWALDLECLLRIVTGNDYWGVRACLVGYEHHGWTRYAPIFTSTRAVAPESPPKKIRSKGPKDQGTKGLRDPRPGHLVPWSLAPCLAPEHGVNGVETGACKYEFFWRESAG